jgi:AraC-like DNA-binding protein
MNTVAIEQPTPPAPNHNGCRVESCESEAVRKVEDSIAYMLRHLDEPLQVATLASRANVSPSHFFALFKRRVGCAPIDYFIRLRMRRACRLLDETVMSVKEVAATLGYEDPFYFSRSFKSVNRVAPSEYRLLKNGAKEAVKRCGITLRFFQPCESRTDLERNGSGLAPDGNGSRSRLELGAGALSGSRNGVRC